VGRGAHGKKHPLPWEYVAQQSLRQLRDEWPHLDPDENMLVVGKADDSVVAALHCVRGPENSAYMAALGVRQDRKGQHLGRSALRHGWGAMRSAGWAPSTEDFYVWCVVHERNKASQATCASVGMLQGSTEYEDYVRWSIVLPPEQARTSPVPTPPLGEPISH